MTTPATAPGSIAPPSLDLPWTQIRGEFGYLTPQAIEFLQLQWSGIAGTGGIIEQIVQNYFTNNISLAIGAPGMNDVLPVPTDVPAATSIAQLRGEIASLRVKVDALQSLRAPQEGPPFPLLGPQLLQNLSASAVGWTPVVAGSTTAGTQTYSAQYGFYGQIGPFILALFDVTLASLDVAAAGNALITGLPIPCNTNWSRFGGWLGLAGGVTLGTSTWAGCFTQAGSANITLIKNQGGSGVTIIPVTALSSTARLSGGVLYAI